MYVQRTVSRRSLQLGSVLERKGSQRLRWRRAWKAGLDIAGGVPVTLFVYTEVDEDPLAFLSFQMCSVSRRQQRPR